MSEPTFDFKKVTGPVSKAADGLKRVKEPGLKRALSGIVRKVQEIEKAASAVEKCAAVTDDKTFKDKEQQLKTLVRACEAAEREVTALANNPVHTASGKKSGGSIEVSSVPDRIRKPTVSDVPDAGSRITGLASALQDAGKLAEGFVKELTSWFKSGSKKGSDITFDVPKVDLVAGVDKKGAITMPNTQCFTGRITIQGIPQVIQTQFKKDLDKLPQKLSTEARKLLDKWKGITEKNFRQWHADFAKYKREHDPPSAKTLFKNINYFFKQELPEKLESELQKMAETAVVDVLPASAKSLKPSITMKADYSDFADFVVDMPDSHPADDLTDGLAGEFKKLERVRSDYTSDADRITTNCESIRTSIDNMDKARDTEQEKYETELKEAAKELQSAVESGKRNLAKIVKGVESATSTFSRQSGSLQKQSSVDQRGMKELGDGFKESKKKLEEANSALKRLGSINLSTVDEIVKNKKQFETAAVRKVSQELKIDDELGRVEAAFGSLKA